MFAVFTVFVMVFCDGVYNVVCNGVCNSVYLDLMRSMKGLQKWSKSGRKKIGWRSLVIACLVCLSHLRLSHLRLFHLRLFHLRLSHLRLSHLRLSHLRLSHLSRLLVCSLRYVLVDDGLMV